MNCAKKIKQRNREMHRRGFLYDPSQTYTPARDRQSLPRTIRPAEWGIVTLWAPPIIMDWNGKIPETERVRTPDVYYKVTDVSKG